MKSEAFMQELIHLKHKTLYITIACSLFVSSACSPAISDIPTLTPSSTVISVPSPTETPTPTATFTPRPTWTPRPTPTPLVGDLGQVIFSESFNDMDFPFLICSGRAQTEAGILIVNGEPSSCGMFSNGIYGEDPIPSDATLAVLFKTTSDFNIGLHAGDYNDGTLRRFSFGQTQGIATWDISTGSNFNSKQTTALNVDSWYFFTVKRSSSGEIEAKLWQPDKPENGIEFHRALGVEWGTLPLTFVADFKDVPFFVDEYQVLK